MFLTTVLTNPTRDLIIPSFFSTGGCAARPSLKDFVGGDVLLMSVTTTPPLHPRLAVRVSY